MSDVNLPPLPAAEMRDSGFPIVLELTLGGVEALRPAAGGASARYTGERRACT